MYDLFHVSLPALSSQEYIKWLVNAADAVVLEEPLWRTIIKYECIRLEDVRACGKVWNTSGYKIDVVLRLWSRLFQRFYDGKITLTFVQHLSRILRVKVGFLLLVREKDFRTFVQKKSSVYHRSSKYCI